MTTIRRNIKNVVCNYTDAQVKVREATSNDPWGPSSTMMSNISDLTRHPVPYTEIMEMIWKRLNDHGKNWRHVYKSLILLENLIKTGSEKVAQQCKENIFAVESLTNFQFCDVDGKDQGHNVREKAKIVVALLKDEERLASERTKAMVARDRVRHNVDRSTAKVISSGAVQHSASHMAQPASPGEEDIQLQLALQLSKDEYEEQQRMKKIEDDKLQLAIEESKTGQAEGASSSTMTKKPVQNLLDDDLAGLNLNTASNFDPWSNGGNSTTEARLAPPVSMGNHHISRTVPKQPANDPWATTVPTVEAPILNNDPWAQTAPASEAMAASATPAFPTGNSSYGGIPTYSSISQPLQPSKSPSILAPKTDNGVGPSIPTKQAPPTANFLGENSRLVNLDQIVTVPKATNPFVAAAQSNIRGPSPIASQNKKPTINELMASAQPPNSFASNPPAPMQPITTNTSISNPFM